MKYLITLLALVFIKSAYAENCSLEENWIGDGSERMLLGFVCTDGKDDGFFEIFDHDITIDVAKGECQNMCGELKVVESKELEDEEDELMDASEEAALIAEIEADIASEDSTYQVDKTVLTKK